MIVVDQKATIVNISEAPLDINEDSARVCYQSHDKRQPGSEEKMAKQLIKSGHSAMLDFADLIADFTTNRAVTHELVHHRLCSFAQESQPYVKYDAGIEFIQPVLIEKGTPEYSTWERSMEEASTAYLELLSYGCTPQSARNVLPNSTATRLRMKANLREWRHILSLRCSKAADPQMQALMKPLLHNLIILIPKMFDDIHANLN
jgi:thymidylate synthase (FAD)